MKKEGCSRALDTVRGTNDPHAIEVTKMRKCDEDNAKARSLKIGRTRGEQEY